MTDSEITRLLAEKVMGWEALQHYTAVDHHTGAVDTEWCWTTTTGDPMMTCDDWQPLTHIEHTWMVYHKMIEGQSRMAYSDEIENMHKKRYFKNENGVLCKREAPDTLSIICLAALKVVGVEV